MSTRVAIGNNKGGVGKSVVAALLAEALADLGKRVLVVDMDPQANVSRRLGRPFLPASPLAGTADVLMLERVKPGSAASAIVPCAWEGTYGDRIAVLPSRFDLENRISEAAVMGARLRLATVLDGADDAYDFTLIDCQPSLGHLTEMALAAAGNALVPTDLEYDGVEGAVRMRDYMAAPGAVRELGETRFLGVIPNRLDGRRGGHAHHLSGLPGIFGQDKVWDVLPERQSIKDSSDEAQPLAFFPRSATAEVREVFGAYAERLVKEAAA